ncbi:uncharacterized protein LOC117304087 [Asterias rubens]|uniref:uncharacterized protein LOC117304087 n=1 Tax=Asterias rubens TaxID=7604 RepID=UPI0014554379|nr:uncharacterized protein LOC117304087 [Asterias rubens]
MKALCGIAICVLILIEVHIAASCSPTRDWRPQSFVDRLENAAIAFKGRVIHMPQPPFYGMYTVKFEVDCVYKTSLPITKEVNVFGFGYDGGMCSSTMVTAGGSYIMLARAPYTTGGNLMVDMVNMQPAAETASQTLLARVQNVHSCQKPE